MTKTKTTKRALIASVLSLLVCFSMLIGSTFAWFTDSASTGVNKIQAGTLDVDLVDAEGNTLVGTTLDFKKATGASADEEILWEPGCTYSLSDIYVLNKGNLNLKYQIVITGIDGDAKLNEAIDWTIKLGDADLTDATAILAPNAKSAELTISGHMKEEAGNEYQGLSIDGISITVVATQATVEYDSEDNQYDKDAMLDATPDDFATVLASAKDGATIKLGAGNYNMAEVVNAAKNLTIVGSEGAAVTEKFSLNKNVEGLTFVNVTFKAGVLGNYKGENAVIKNLKFIGCNFVDGGHIFMDSNTIENVTVENCYFDLTGASNDMLAETGGHYTPSNLIFGNVTNATIKNNEFVNSHFNAIQLSKNVGGAIVIEGNTINGTTDRALRIADVQANATISIKDNVINGCKVAATEGEGVMKISTIGEGATVTLSDNTVDGKAWNPTVNEAGAYLATAN